MGGCIRVSAGYILSDVVGLYYNTREPVINESIAEWAINLQEKHMRQIRLFANLNYMLKEREGGWGGRDRAC